MEDEGGVMTQLGMPWFLEGYGNVRCFKELRLSSGVEGSGILHKFIILEVS